MIKRSTRRTIQSALLLGASATFMVSGAGAAAAQARVNENRTQIDIPAQPLGSALRAFGVETDSQVMFSKELVEGRTNRAVKGNYSAAEALDELLKGTTLRAEQSADRVFLIKDHSARSMAEPSQNVQPIQLAQTTPVARAAVETVTVTSSKLGGADVQSIPIAITALSQEQLQAMKVEGGPDLLKEIPNMTFTKTNFTSYNIQIRGIGTQAISVTTDPAVAVAFNDIPFIRNHLFEQEFFDVEDVEVLRGPQGTLYGRNATAGVVNVRSAKPSDMFEGSVKVETGNYNSRRLVGMLNVPISDDRVDVRFAGAWTRRDGYAFNQTTNESIDGRDLWSGRVTLGFKPVPEMQAYLVWEHFQEDDDRVRSAKQLCKKDTGPDSVAGLDLTTINEGYAYQAPYFHALLSQGCLPTSLYSPNAYETPNGASIPFVFFGAFIENSGGGNGGFLLKQVDPYASNLQSPDLRVIQSEISPTYKAKNDVVELNADYRITPTLALSSQTGYSKDQLSSTEDFNRFNTTPGIFANATGYDDGFNYEPNLAPNGIYCDPQLGCSSKMVGEDLSREHAWQFNQEVRMASNFSGPLNFSVGSNYTYYETTEDYFVFFNILSLLTQQGNRSGVGDFTHCYDGSPSNPRTTIFNLQPNPVVYSILFYDPPLIGTYPAQEGCSRYGQREGTYIDPNPISSVDGQGHNYFRSENPYRLASFAGFGEVYYQIDPELKLTGGLRWTDDRKRFWDIPSWAYLEGGGYPVEGIVDQEWKEWTGRANATWTPKLRFTDQTLVYVSYAHGYKGGGANPPRPAINLIGGLQGSIAHPATFEPEFINAYELGTKNSMLDGRVTLNGDVFYYDYKGYQISQIVDRTSVNLNFNAKVKGAELESTWEPVPGLRFNFAGGYETSSVNKGQSAIDLIDRTAGNSNYFVVKPFVTDTSNCILPADTLRQWIEKQPGNMQSACEISYISKGYASFGITGFDPSAVPNNGEGITKDLSGKQLPNTPHFTLSLGGQYAIPITQDWTAVVRSDFYWQSSSYARIFNNKPYDELRGWTNLNLSLMVLNNDGWMVEGYVKNLLNTTAITGAFLNSDDTALTTNVFVTDPRLVGVSITKNW